MSDNAASSKLRTKPNVVFVFGDQWRAQATGYAGDPNARTPRLDALARESINFVNAVSGCSVCCPYRASLLTGQYPLTNGVFINDVELKDNGNSIAQAFARGGWDTAYIGKWHLYGSPDGKYNRRQAFVPREARQGFDFWMAHECSHDYNHSPYYEGDDPTMKYWDGYDALAQCRAAANYIKDHAGADKPYFLVVSLGPPHDPYHTAPEKYKAMFAGEPSDLRPNVPADWREKAIESLRGYYAHIAACDDAVKIVLDALDETGQADDTLFVFTSDHGDMHGSQGLTLKTHPWDESIRVPFLLRWPARLGRQPRELPSLIDAPDIMPTLLGLVGEPIPPTVQGRDYSPVITGAEPAGRGIDGDEEAAIISIPVQFNTMQHYGLPEHRGLRTARYTYVRTHEGPWLLYDNETDPYQMKNLAKDPAHAEVVERLEALLQKRLRAIGDDFRPGMDYARQWGYEHYGELRWQSIDYVNPWGAW